MFPRNGVHGWALFVGMLTPGFACAERGPGEVEWVVLHDGPAGTVDRALGAAAYEQGVVAAGWISASGPDGDVARLWVAGYDARGRSTFTIESAASETRGLFASDVAVLADGSIVVAGGVDAGELDWDAWVSLFRPNLEQAWTRTMGEVGREDQAVAVAVSQDDTIAVAGYTSLSDTDVDAFLWQLSAKGEPLGFQPISGPAGGFDVATELAFFPGGDVLVVGYQTSDVPGDETDVWVRRQTATGAVRFDHREPRVGIDRAQAVAVLPDGDFVLGGFQCEPGRALDAFVSRHDGGGEMRWEVLTDGPGGFADAVNDLAVGRAGEIYVAGYEYVRDAGFDAVVRRLTPDGELEWEIRRAGPAGADDVAAGLATDDAGRLFAVGAQTQTLEGEVRDVDALVMRLVP